eukprot:scaffold445705_cov56-Prasinocladus_malaysianus.AAC.1
MSTEILEEQFGSSSAGLHTLGSMWSITVFLWVSLDQSLYSVIIQVKPIWGRSFVRSPVPAMH